MGAPDERGRMGLADRDRTISRMLRSVDAREPDIVALTESLIRVPTENPPGIRYEECARVLEGALTGLGLPVERVPVGTRGGVAILSRIGSGPEIRLHGHYDVVPAQDVRQFRPRRADGRIHGRGSADMKGALAAKIFALWAVREAVERLGGSAGFVAVPDEESGGAQGTAELLEAGFLDDGPVAAITGEPTSGVLWNGSRGAITLSVTVSGRSAHVGLQHEGVNAFEASLPVLRALAGLKADVERRVTASAMESETERRSILMMGGIVSGGHNFNVVPERFTFSIERRFNPEEDRAVERDRILQVIHESLPQDVDVHVDVVQEADSSGIDAAHELCTGVSRCVEAVTGMAPAVRLCPGLLETRFYARAGVPSVAYGPGLLSVAHGPEEYVEIPRLLECARIYALSIVELLERAGDGSLRDGPPPTGG